MPDPAQEKFTVEAVLDVVLGKLRTLAETGHTFGTPITVGATTIVPYMSLAFGLGGGGGQTAPFAPQAQWGSAGGGVRIEPIGFLVIRDDKVELLSIDQKPSQWGKVAEGLLPVLQQLMQQRHSSSLELEED